MAARWRVETGNPASYRVEGEQGCAIVVASGVIDLDTAAEFQRALDLAVTLSGRIVVELADVRFMDSTGLGIVLRARDRGNSPSISLVQPPKVLRKVLHLTSLGEVVPVYPTRQDAIDETNREHPM
jgi:anti-sigma B factor antagonist